MPVDPVDDFINQFGDRIIIANNSELKNVFCITRINEDNVIAGQFIIFNEENMPNFIEYIKERFK